MITEKNDNIIRQNDVNLEYMFRFINDFEDIIQYIEMLPEDVFPMAYVEVSLAMIHESGIPRSCLIRHLSLL